MGFVLLKVIHANRIAIMIQALDVVFVTMDTQLSVENVAIISIVD
jgi:hypothetical protein